MENRESLGRLGLRPREAARALGISIRCLWSLTQPRGPLPCLRLGTGRRRAVVYPVDVLKAWMAAELQRQCGVETAADNLDGSAAAESQAAEKGGAE